MPDILSVPVPNGTAALAWSGRQAGISTILFYNTDTVNTVYLGSLSNITPGGTGTIPILPNGTFSGDPSANWYVTGSAAGIVPLVVVPNGQGYFLGITAGLGNLVIPSVQSPNFVHDVSGWQIAKDGSAEFNNLTVRGTFYGTDYIINVDGIFFYSGTPAAGNLVLSIAPSAGSDTFGNAYPEGFNIIRASVSSGTQVGLSTGATNEYLPGSIIPYIENQGGANEFYFMAHRGPVNVNQKDQTYVLHTSSASDLSSPAQGYMVYVDTTGGQNTVCFWDYHGFTIYVASSITAVKPGTGTSVSNAAVPETWHSVTGDSGWTAVSGYSGIQYRLKADGNVQFTGAAQHTSLTTTTAINSSNPLATAYRPATIKILSSGNSPLSRLMVEYRTDGILYALANASSPATIAEVDKAVPLSP